MKKKRQSQHDGVVPSKAAGPIDSDAGETAENAISANPTAGDAEDILDGFGADALAADIAVGDAQKDLDPGVAADTVSDAEAAHVVGDAEYDATGDADEFTGFTGIAVDDSDGIEPSSASEAEEIVFFEAAEPDHPAGLAEQLDQQRLIDHCIKSMAVAIKNKASLPDNQRYQSMTKHLTALMDTNDGLAKAWNVIKSHKAKLNKHNVNSMKGMLKRMRSKPSKAYKQALEVLTQFDKPEDQRTPKEQKSIAEINSELKSLNIDDAIPTHDSSSTMNRGPG